MIEVQAVAFGPQPHDRLACQCSASHAVSVLPGKKYILGIPHLRPFATLNNNGPPLSGVIITKKVRYHGEKFAQPFPPLASLQQRRALLG